jgi:tetratricopeptide (TPR) repeat protein
MNDINKKDNLMEEISAWVTMCMESKFDEVDLLYPALKKIADDSSDFQIKTLFAFGETYYCNGMPDQTVSDAACAFLDDYCIHLPPNEGYIHFIARGGRSFVRGEYKHALRDFLVAQHHGDTLDIANQALTFCIANCLSTLGYAYSAEKYLLEAKKIAVESGYEYNDIHHDILHAICLKNTGRPISAIQKLIECREQLLEKNPYSEDFVSVLHGLGNAYLDLKHYDEAIRYFDESIKLEKELKSPHPNSFYLRALALAESGNADGANAYIEEILSSSACDNVDVITLLTALKSLLNIDKGDDFLSYITDTAIPHLITVGKHLDAIWYCDKLHNHFSNIGDEENALKYHKMSLLYKDKTNKGEIFSEEPKENVVCMHYGDSYCVWKCSSCSRS